MPERKVLILTAGFGEGHNTAARSIRDAVAEAAPEGWEAVMLDLFEECHPVLNSLARRGYLFAINRTPRIWCKIYEWIDRSPTVENRLNWFVKLRKVLEQKLEEHQPAVVVSTYPVYAYLINELFPEAARRPFRTVTVVTDSISINSIWHHADSDWFLTANEETAKVLMEAGVDERKIRVTGFPVSPRFAALADERPDPVEGERRVLYVINSGRRHAVALVRELCRRSDLRLTVTVGRDEKLRREVEGVVGGARHPVSIYGWTDQMPELLANHHLLIAKAGGATVQEAIAAKCPMIMSQVVPGQEEGNARLLLGREAGAQAEGKEKILQAVEEAFRDDAKRFRRWRDNIASLSRPDAALKIAQWLISDVRSQ